MFEILKRLFVRRSPADATASRSERPLPDGTELEPRPRSFAELRRALRDTGHPDFPFLDRDYSPASRVPCTDFTPFITDRLQAGDVRSIAQVMRAIVEANPGLGVGPEWIGPIVEEVARADFGTYVTFGTPRGELELRALFIVAGKDGGGRPFWIADGNKPGLFALALACQRPLWHESMDYLRRRANAFIRRMRKEAPFWEDYPTFSPHCFEVEPPPECSATDATRKLSLASRIHLLHFAGSRTSGSPLKTTTYAMRNLGVHAEQTGIELRREGLLVPSQSDEGLLDVWSKDDLVQACMRAGAVYRKSWTKDRLLGLLREKAPEVIVEAREREGFVELDPHLAEELRGLADYARRLQDALKLLCFI
jgi:hypothetical protein